MNTLIKLSDKTVCTEKEFRNLYRNTSFSSTINYADFGYAVVFPSPAPAHDSVTQRAQIVAPVYRTTTSTWEQQWQVVELYPVAADKAEAIAAKLAANKAAFILQVKSEAGQLTQQVRSGLGSEYELAEKEATAYKAAGYPATPIPGSVQSEINSKATKGVTITATTACNTILTAATGWRNAQSALRDNRLVTVSAAEVAVDGAALDVIKADRAAFMAALKTQLGVL